VHEIREHYLGPAHYEIYYGHALLLLFKSSEVNAGRAAFGIKPRYSLLPLDILQKDIALPGLRRGVE